MRPPRANAYRDSWSGEIDAGRAGDMVRVAGWVHRRRDHGGLIFIDLRDRTGIVQLVFHPDQAPDAHARAHRLRSEDVITVTGEVVRRDEANVNPNIPTGEIEITVADWELLADAETPPFPIDEDGPVDESLRLQHRALDIRRPRMRGNLELRHRVVQAIRSEMEARDFIDVETPILTRSTPEGARDFLVPARMAPGSFFALPQSPQLFKQLLMIGGPGALLPDRALLPRRGLARRPPARVHPARRGDVLRRGGRRHRRDRGHAGARLRGGGLRGRTRRPGRG